MAVNFDLEPGRTSGPPTAVPDATEDTKGIVLLARDEDVGAAETDLTRLPNVAKAILLWRRLRGELNEVPDTPGTQAAIGHVLTVTGRNNKDRAWRAPAPGQGGAGVDQTARDSAQANADEIDELQQTVILEMHPAVVYGGNSEDAVGTYHLNIQTPTPIATAVRAEINFQAVRVSNGGFSATEKQQTIQFGVNAATVANLNNNGHLVIGTNLPVTLIVFAAGNAELVRYTVDIPIVSRPADDDDPTPYTLPQATESVLGGVRGATSAQATAGSGTVILGWTLNRIKQAISQNIPAATASVRGGVNAITQTVLDAGTSTAVFGWSISNVLRAARSTVSTWAIKNDVSTIPAAKLGAGVRDNSKFLRDDGTWQNVAGAGGADAVARAAAAANQAVVERLSVFGSIQVTPPGISDKVFPENIAVSLANKLDSRTLAEIRVFINGESVAIVNTADGLAPFNGYHTVEPATGQPGNNVSQGGEGGSEGGIINLTLREADRRNLLNINSAAQWVLIEIFYKFAGTSLALDVPADDSDRKSFGVNNNAFIPPPFDLRANAATSATPVAGDRFFFTDENQPDDPIRYVQYRDLEAAFRKFNPQPLFSANYTWDVSATSNRYQKLTDTLWPDDAEYLMVSLNPTGRYNHHTEEGHIIRNPRKGRYSGDNTPTTAVVHNVDLSGSGDDKGIGFTFQEYTHDVPVGILFGRDARNRIMVVCSHANGVADLSNDVSFTPLVIQKL